MTLMDMFYGYERQPEDAPETCGKLVFIDADGTDRQGRADMLVAVREGDAVIALARGDFGKGAEAHHIIAAIEAKGGAVDIRTPEKPARRKPGPSPKFQPNPEQDRRIEALWRGGMMLRYVIAEASKEYGEAVADHQLKRRYGPRWKK